MGVGTGKEAPAMAKSTPHRYPVLLTDERRAGLEELVRNGRSSAKKIAHARVLLLSDRGREGGKLSASEIGAALGIHVNTIDRIRKRFSLLGEAPALERKRRETPPTPPKLDGAGEAALAAVCCSPAPEGRTRWTLSLLADELGRRRVVTSICAETVRAYLKKTSSSRGPRRAGSSRRRMPPASSPRWRSSSTPTRPRTPRRSR